MEEPTANPIDVLLDSLFDRLAGTGAAGRRALAEAEDHLHAAVSKAIDRGLSLEEAQREAVVRFGRPDRFGHGIRTANGGVAAILRPAFVGAWLVGSVILITIGFSGLLAELLGRWAGVAFVSGDGPGVTYTFERCAEFQEYFPQLNCLDAATMHHFGEVVQYRVAVGVLGLLALGVLFVLRRTTDLGSARWTPSPGVVSAVVVAALGAAGILLLGTSTLGLVGGSRNGMGTDLSAGVAAGVVAVGAGIWAVRRNLRVTG